MRGDGSRRAAARLDSGRSAKNKGDEGRDGSGTEPGSGTIIYIENRTVIAIELTEKSFDIENEGVHSMPTGAKPEAHLKPGSDLKMEPELILMIGPWWGVELTSRTDKNPLWAVYAPGRTGCVRLARTKNLLKQHEKGFTVSRKAMTTSAKAADNIAMLSARDCPMGAQ
ncbi:hypothetical protein EVAR_66418_1 [Eumeta japonica]|uniref:Uncharacterized protein n=1 Tax=Eumeta variegata TaxID=151549 RepID=A0A4C2A006_EUMVA|nr:hypothetical protein EVAR_66418_1 [Eumeta japonica]